METERTKRTITNIEIVRAHAILTDNLVQKDTGHVAYLNGFSDEKVAAEIGCPESSIRKLRQDMFGKLRERWLPKPEPLPWEARVDMAALSANNAHLSDKVRTLEAAINAIEQRVKTDVREMAGSNVSMSAKVQTLELEVARLEQSLAEKIEYHVNKYDRFKAAVNERVDGYNRRITELERRPARALS